MKIIFATHNQNKVEELKQIVPSKYSLLSLNDIGCIKEIKETGSTLEENAKIKADYVRYKYGLECFSDDSGLEIDTLGGAPGVYSARYAGDQKNNDANIEKIWKELKGIKNPRAIFRSVIYVHLNQKKYYLFKSMFYLVIQGWMLYLQRLLLCTDSRAVKHQCR